MATSKRPSPDAVFRAIADPTRRRILQLLRTGELTVGEIALNFHTSRPAISKHLGVLRTAGLVRTREDGAARVCSLDAAPLRAVGEWVAAYQSFWERRLDHLEDLLKRMDP